MVYTYVDHVYETVKNETAGLDSVYGDYIQQLIGSCGLDALIKTGLLESCGVINGRQLYVLVNKN